MNSSEIFEALKKKENFEANACNWMALQEENPFNDNTQEHEYFATAQKYFRRWQNKGIDSRSAKRYMINTIRRLIELGVENPYKKENIVVLGVLPEEPTEETKKEPIEEAEKEIEEENLEPTNYYWLKKEVEI